MALNDNSYYPFYYGTIHPSSGGRTNLSLNSAYVHGTSGAGIGIRFTARITDPIDELYIFLDDYIGTLGNITMRARIYNEHSSTATQPGSTLRATSTTTTMPGAVDKWIKFEFGTPYSPAGLGEILWFVVDNTSGAPATDAPGILNATTTSTTGPQTFLTAYSTTAGFSSAGTSQGELSCVYRQGGRSFGKTASQTTVAVATTTLKRGVRVIPPVTTNIYGFSVIGTTALTGVQVFDDATGPGGSPLWSYALGTDANESRDESVGGKVFDTLLTLQGGVAYKFVFTVGSTSTLPSSSTIVEDYASYSAVFDDLVDHVVYLPLVIDDGAGGWTTNNAVFPAVQLHIDSFPPVGIKTTGSSFGGGFL